MYFINQLILKNINRSFNILVIDIFFLKKHSLIYKLLRYWKYIKNIEHCSRFCALNLHSLFIS